MKVKWGRIRGSVCVCVFKFGSVTAVLKTSVCLFPTVTLNSRNGATPTAGSDDGEGKAVRKTDNNKIPEGDLLLQVSSVQLQICSYLSLGSPFRRGPFLRISAEADVDLGAAQRD